MGTTDDCTTVHPPTARTKTNKYPRVPGCPILFAFSAKGWEPQTIALRLHPQLPEQKRINIPGCRVAPSFRVLCERVGTTDDCTTASPPTAKTKTNKYPRVPGCPILFAFSAQGWEPQTIALR